MVKYNIGDTIRIIKTLSNLTNVPYRINTNMIQYAGHKANITNVSRNDILHNGKYYDKYTLDIDAGEFSWNILMFDESNITIKLELMGEVFRPIPITITKAKERIDNEQIQGNTRAFDIWYKYEDNNQQPTKQDLIYINNTVAKLINILGTDIKSIANLFDYINFEFGTNIDVWKRNYSKLIKIMTNDTTR